MRPRHKRCPPLRRQSGDPATTIPVRPTVTLQSSGKQFRVEPGETVLEAARRAGLALPYSCLSGEIGRAHV